MRGHSSISNLTDRHTALTRCLSARGASTRAGASGREGEGGGGREEAPNSTQQHLIQIITPGEHGGAGKQGGERGHGHTVSNSEPH